MAQPSQPVRVLVIDDDPMSRDLLAVLLEAEGYAVESADSGESALAELHGNIRPPNLILADMNMPGATGAQLARKLRHACGSATLLIAISGSRPNQEALADFDRFLLKPFTMQQIAAALAEHRPQNSTPDPPSPSPQQASKPAMESRVQEAPLSEVAGDEPILNEKIYRQLTVAMTPQQLDEMYALCIKDARERIARMHQLLATRDTTRFIREAHTIKGSCGMLGATQLHSMAAELEQRGLDPDSSQHSHEVNSLDELSAACDRLERMLGSRV